MMKRSAVSLIIALVLAFALVAANPAAVSAASDGPWYNSIPQMLAAGEYEEGVVIAGIDMSKAKRAGDPGSALESSKLRKDTEELIEVDTEDAASQKEFLSWLKNLLNRTDRQSDDGICITAIRRSDMSTDQILRLLASDDSVVFAEPNYITGMGSEEDEDPAEEPPRQKDPAAGRPVTSASCSGAPVRTSPCTHRKKAVMSQ